MLIRSMRPARSSLPVEELFGFFDDTQQIDWYRLAWLSFTGPVDGTLKATPALARHDTEAAIPIMIAINAPGDIAAHGVVTA